jgi:sugar phosphate isomerase/epimerase
VTGEHVGQPMSEADVADTVDAFVRAAADADRLGFDGVELLAAHGYLITSHQAFLTGEALSEIACTTVANISALAGHGSFVEGSVVT